MSSLDTFSEKYDIKIRGKLYWSIARPLFFMIWLDYSPIPIRF